MKKLSLLLALMITFLVASAQDYKYSRVRVFTGHDGVSELLSIGIPVDDAEIRPGAYITCEISQPDIEKIEAAGYRYEILIEDVASFYEERSAKEMGMLDQLKHADYLLNRDWSVPEGFDLGSIGGFCSIDEMFAHLDSMVAQYPDLISPVYPMDSLTHEGRVVYWLRISDNPTQNEDEPEVLYTGMHHAREPIGMQHLLYFMYYLLENYESDAEIQYLINNTELYFVPIINMDGYARNILTSPNGGGQWRKNRRDNGDGTFGVDPNRNYGFAWGYNNYGSSSDPGDATYRGPAAFSEPCIQNMRDFCESHEFRIALNYHSYSNLFLYPWGYLAELPPDDEILSAYSAIMTKENGYTYGPGYTTIYETNGGSDDWMYGEQSTKDMILSWTPEVGGSGDGFWPTPSRIIPLCQENMWQSMMAAKLVGPYAEVKDQSPTIVESTEGFFKHTIKRLGLDESGEYTVYISPVNDAITSVGDPIVYSSLGLLESAVDSIAFTLKDDIQNGDEIIYVLSVNNGYYTSSEIINKIYGIPVVVFEDEGSTFTNWTSSRWNTTTEDFVSPDKSITDSPFGNYNNYEANAMVLNEPIDLSEAAFAVLGFWAKWEIEPGYDYVQVEASTDGFNWTPLEGNYTKEGTEYQAPGEPVYDGFQADWVYEEMNLESFIGQEIYLRFLLRADSYVVEDGFYWDDLEVTIIDIYTGTDDLAPQHAIKINGPVPNPATENVHFSFNSSENMPGINLKVYNSNGQVVAEYMVNGEKDLNLPLSGWSDGVYFFQFSSEGTVLKSGKFIVR